MYRRTAVQYDLTADEIDYVAAKIRKLGHILDSPAGYAHAILQNIAAGCSGW